MKKVLLTILSIVIVLGVLAGAGYAGYRYGFRQSVGTTANGTNSVKPFVSGNDLNRNRMPFMHNFNGMGPGFHQGFGPHGGMMLFGGRGFGFMSLLFFLVRIAFYGVLIWIVYKLLTGWRISISQVNQTPKPVEPETKQGE